MTTSLRIGPAEHGRAMSYEEFMAGDYQEGYLYEIIDGRLYVSPKPNRPHAWVLDHVYEQLLAYSKSHASVVNYVTSGARVFVPNARRATVPEPDLAVYHDAPDDPEVNWDEISPMLVIEVLGGDDEQKDLIRNVELYWQVLSIQEYWVIDVREDARRPLLRVFRREAQDWAMQEYQAQETYRTARLPGFELSLHVEKRQ